MFFLRLLSSTLFFLILSSNAVAYIGLCCAHCGGNMPLNIPGGGIPETHEFRFKISEMFMQMDALRDGTDEKKTFDYGNKRFKDRPAPCCKKAVFFTGGLFFKKYIKKIRYLSDSHQPDPGALGIIRKAK